MRTADIQLGTWMTIGSPVVAELASQYAFDWLLFDLEHGCFSEGQLLSNLQAVRNPDIKIIVRIGGYDPALILRLLDWGASGIMLPHVSTAAQAEECLAAMYYPPRGHRGYSGSVRAYKYGMNSPSSPADVKPFFLAQIEDVEGVENADEIAAVPGVDVLFVGPADLKLSLSTMKNESSIGYQEALEKVFAATGTHGKKAGILIRDSTQFAPLKQMGYSCLAIDSDLAVLKAGYEKIMGMR